MTMINRMPINNTRRKFLICIGSLIYGISGCTTNANSEDAELQFQEISVEQLSEKYKILIVVKASDRIFNGVYVEGKELNDGSVICQREIGNVSPDEEPTKISMTCPEIPGLIALRADEDLCSDDYKSDVAYNKGIYDSADQERRTASNEYRYETLQCYE